MEDFKGLIIDSDSEIEVVVSHSEDDEHTSSHFFPGYGDPKMDRAINELNQNQIVYTRRGKPQDNTGPAGIRFYNAVCGRCARVYIREDGKIITLSCDPEGRWKKRIPNATKVAAAAPFIARRGEIAEGN